MNITPKANLVKVESDKEFVFSTSTKFVNEDLLESKGIVAKLFSELEFEKGVENVVSFALEETKSDEEYCLTVGENIEIVASSRQGLLRALATLKQLIFENISGKVAQIPYCKIEDKPRFSYRGFMLDVSRHFFGVEVVKKVLDAMWLLKLNVFHMHLCDNQGFRLQIDSLPKLHEVGSVRKQTRGDNKEVKGYYTKADIAEIIDYATQRGIEVIPEIDMPGHTIAMLAAYPELSCNGEAIEVGESFGIAREILCAGKEHVYDFLFKLLDEVAVMFPSKYIHLGGDEAPKYQWEECDDCKNAVKKLGLRDMEDLQGHFTNRVIEYLKKLGKTAIVWNESLNSGILDSSAVCQYWQDGKVPRRVFAAADSGRKTIVSKFSPYYLDYPYGMFSLKKTYLFEPIMDGFSTMAVGNVWGVESPLWTEYVDSQEKLFYQAFPRLIATAESGWSSCKKDFDDFQKRVLFVQDMLAKIGIVGASVKESMPSVVKGSFKVLKFFANAFDKNAVKSLFNAQKAKQTRRTE